MLCCREHCVIWYTALQCGLYAVITHTAGSMTYMSALAWLAPPVLVMKNELAWLLKFIVECYTVP